MKEKEGTRYKKTYRNSWRREVKKRWSRWMKQQYGGKSVTKISCRWLQHEEKERALDKSAKVADIDVASGEEVIEAGEHNNVKRCEEGKGADDYKLERKKRHW